MIIQRKEAESEVTKPLLFLFSGISLQFLRMETKGKQKSLPSGPSSTRLPSIHAVCHCSIVFPIPRHPNSPSFPN